MQTFRLKPGALAAFVFLFGIVIAMPAVASTSSASGSTASNAPARPTSLPPGQTDGHLPVAINLGAARQFNGFFRESYTATSSDVQGRLAAGGDISINHYSIADQLQAQNPGASLVVGGDLEYPNGRVYTGDILVAGNADGVGSAVINGLDADQELIESAEMPFDFDAEFARIEQVSAELSALPENGTVTAEYGGLYLEGDCQSPSQVFQLDGQLVLDAHTFDVSCVPEGATIIFNISGSSPGLTNMSLESLSGHARTTLFNFHEASSLTLAGVGVHGSILAPFADIDQPQGVVYGAVVGNSWNGLMQLNHEPFRGVGAGDFCAMYPIALPGDVLSVSQPGDEVLELPRGTGPGNFSWLTWTGSPSTPTLANSLVPPGDSYTYINPDDDTDWLLTPGDWAQGAPGAMNGSAVRQNLDALLGMEITVPVWSSIRGQGNSFDYEINQFARIQLLDYRLPGHGWFSFEFLGYTNCYNRPPVAQDQVIEAESGVSVAIQLEGTDPDGDGLTFEVIDGPGHGSLSGQPPNLQYTSQEGYSGPDEFLFIVDDGYLSSEPAAISLNVLNPNLPPEIVSDPITHVSERSLYSYDVDAIDPDDDVLAYTLELGPAFSDMDGGSGEVAWPSEGAQAFSSIAAMNSQCRVAPEPIASMDVEIEWEWHGEPDYPNRTDVVAPPLVGQLTDDNGDGVIGPDDQPDVVFAASNHSHNPSRSILVAVDGATGTTLWSNPDFNVSNRGGIALGDLDQDGQVEIVGVGIRRQRLFAFEHDGTLKWDRPLDLPTETGAADTISLNDLDGDGSVEIVLANQVYSADGHLVWTGDGDRGAGGNRPSWGWISVVADIDLDGQAEVVAGRTAYDTDGTTLWHRDDLPSDGYNAIGNFDADDYPEILVSGGGSITLLNHDGSTVWGPYSIPGAPSRGGPPTIGDVDGDGEPEIGVVGATEFTVLETDGSVKWTYPIQDGSSAATGATVFDFNGDNRVELAYGDERFFRIFDGATGRVLLETPNRSVTSTEYPVLADIDADGEAELLVVSNDGSNSTNGVRAFGSVGEPWAPTRAIWNQHAYSITNVADDGTIPLNPEPSWLAHNTYRLNAFPDQHALGQPDLALFDLVLDQAADAVSFEVRNRGLAPTVSGFSVQLFDGDPADGAPLLGEAAIGPLAAGESIVQTIGDIDVATLIGPLYGVVDSEDQVPECIEANNQVAAALFRARAQDPEGLSDDQAWLVNVINVNEAPSILTSELPPAEDDLDYSVAIDAVDPDLGDALRYELLDGPEGLRINEVDGQLTWLAISNEVGTFSVDIRVSDLGGLYDERALQLTVDNGVDNPPVAFDQSIETNEGIAVDLTLVGEDPENQPISYEVTELPAHGRLVGAPPHLTYVPDAYYDGPDQFQFVVSDQSATSDPATVSIDIVGENNPPRIISEPVTPHVLNSGQTEPEPQRLSDWEIVEMPAIGSASSDWDFVDQGYTAIQRDNASPSVIGGVLPAVGRHFEGTWQTNSTDDDYFGFVIADVLPYRFYRFRWKKNSQLGEDRGMSLVAYDIPVDGSVPLSLNEFGLATTKGTVLYENDLAWSRGELYSYTVDFRPGVIHISVKDDSGLIEAVTVNDSTVLSGMFGIYHSSITDTRYTVSASEIGSDNAYQYDVEAIDPDGDALTYRLVEAPGGVFFNSETGTIRWETTVEDTGSYPVTVEVEDEHGLTATQTYQLVVQEEQPVIVSEPQETTQVGTQYRYLVTAIDPNPNDQLTYSLESGPDGASIDPDSGLLTWTPGSNSLGNHDFTVRVTDSLGLIDEQTFTLQVVEAVQNEPPIFTSEPVVEAYVGQLYVYTPQAEDPDGDPIEYGLVGDLPYHMQIFDGENITWQPGEDQIRDWTITVDARDGRGGVTAQTFTIRVVDISGNRPPSILSEPQVLAAPESTYDYQVVANDPDGDELAYSLTEAPGGMTVDSDGLLSWSTGVDSSGFYPVTLRVEDGRGGYAEQSYTIAVNEGLNNSAPSIESTPVFNAIAGATYQYDVAATDPDGDPLVYTLTQAPDGMSVDAASGLIQWTPPLALIGPHDVAVEVSDGRGGAVTQSYTLNVTQDAGANQPPTITSEPEVLARTGFAYSYPIEAADPDGDPLSYALTSGPEAMTLDSDGVLEWSPQVADIGTHEIEIEVSDGRGGRVRQWYSLVVVDGADNNPPQILSTPPESARVDSEYRYSVVAQDPEGDPINYALTQAPPTMTIDDQGGIRWTPTGTGQATATVRVDDGAEFSTQTWTITVEPADADLAVSVSAQPEVVDPGEAVTISVSPTGMTGEYTLEAEFDGTAISLNESNQAVVNPSEPGSYQVTATLTDDSGTATDSAIFTVREAESNPPPEVSLNTPDYEANITAPIDIFGSVSDENLDNWILAYAETGTQNWVTLAEGTNEFSDANLAKFDPTLLRNGQYRIALQAWDAQGQTESDSREIQVTGEMKLGHFSMSFEDVTVPLSGIPVTLTRTYDSRDRAKSLDFGFGWSVGYKDVRLQESRRVGLGWTLNEYPQGPYFSNWCVEPNGNPIVTIALPGGDVERFRAKASPECTNLVPTVYVDIVFEALPGTNSTLTQSDIGQVRLVNENLVDLGSPDVPVDPNRYTLTLEDGTELEVDQGFGLRQLTDPNDNTLTYTENGIEHSSGVGIEFVRDGQGRIEQVLLPDGEMLDYVYDASGDLTAFSDERNNVTQFTYLTTAPHYLEDVIDPRGVRAIRNEYDSDGRLVAQIDAAGNRLEFDHDIDGRTETIADRRGNSSLFVYDDRGYVVSETNALGETTSRTYDEFGNELTRTDPLGHVWEMAYDSRGNQTVETNPLGETTNFSYNNRGQVLTHTAPDGTVVLDNQYSSQTGNLTASTDALDHATSFAYGMAGNLTSTTDALGQETQMFYDSNGSLVREIDSRGVETTFTHDAMGRVLTETVTWTDGDGNPESLVTAHEYDANGNRIKTTDPLGAVRISEYDEADQLIAEIDPLGRRTEYEYDDRGNQVLIRHPDGSTETSEYDPEGNLIAETDRAGRTTRMVYDAAGRQIETILPDATPGDDSDNPRRYSIYNAAGHLVEEIDERGNRTYYEYDAAGRNTKVIDALGNETVYEYDVRGQRTAMINARGHRTEYEYDAAGRQVKTIHPDGTESSVTYDALGQKSAETDPAGQVTRFEYDPSGNLTAVVDALDQRTEYAYDEQGNRISETDANGHTTTWTFDATGRVLSRALPMGQTETFQYDAAGQRTSRTDFKGQTLQFDYDALGQPTETIYPDGSSVQTRYTATGQIWEIEVTCTPAPCSVEGKEVGVTVYQYDERDRLTRIDYPAGRWIEYAYDAAGNRTEVGTANQLTRYGFDALNRLDTVVDCDDAQCATGLTTQYHYNAAGSRSAVNHANGTTTAYEYDALNRLTDLTTWDSAAQVIHSQVFTLGAAGHRIRVEESDGRVVDYDYDALYRLVEEAVADSRGNRTTTYTFDSVGNRLSRTTSCSSGCSGELEAGVTTYVYDANDRLLEKIGSAGTTTYQYDANGNTTTKVAPDGTVDYDYNVEDRLTHAAGNLDSGALEANYTYDAHGIRQRQTVDGLTTRFLVDPMHEHAQVLEELDDSGNPIALYVIGHERISQQRASSHSTFHADGLGSVRALTDLSGAKTDSYVYEAFGDLEHSEGNTLNSFRYTGEQYDPNLGFYYLRARYYDPTTGRFPTMDSYQGRIHEPQTLHKYLYVHADPVNLIDPSGNITLGGLVTGLNISIGRSLAAVRTGFLVSRSVGGAALRSLGLVVERSASIVLRKVLGSGASIDRGVRLVGVGGQRVLDFWIRVGNRVAILEAKYKLPSQAGAQLTRLVSQIRTAQTSQQAIREGAQVVLWSYRAPTPAQMNLVLSNLGRNASGVQLVDGLLGLARWARWFFLL